jgi:hypothetical protein
MRNYFYYKTHIRTEILYHNDEYKSFDVLHSVFVDTDVCFTQTYYLL